MTGENLVSSFLGGPQACKPTPSRPRRGRLNRHMDVLKVSAQSKPKSVAGALAAVLREKGGVEIQAIGAGAVNQAVKGIAIARGYVAPNGIDLVCIPAFTEIEINGEERTAIRFIVEGKQAPSESGDAAASAAPKEE